MSYLIGGYRIDPGEVDGQVLCQVDEVLLGGALVLGANNNNKLSKIGDQF